MMKLEEYCPLIGHGLGHGCLHCLGVGSMLVGQGMLHQIVQGSLRLPLCIIKSDSQTIRITIFISTKAQQMQTENPSWKNLPFINSTESEIVAKTSQYFCKLLTELSLDDGHVGDTLVTVIVTGTIEFMASNIHSGHCWPGVSTHLAVYLLIVTTQHHQIQPIE
jgi:hypothetical protein